MKYFAHHFRSAARSVLAVLVLWTVSESTSHAAGPAGSSIILPPGQRPRPHEVHALTNATVVIKPGGVLNPGTIVVRDGRIEAVGTDIGIPQDARTWDLEGGIVYAGFIESYYAPSANSRSRGGDDDHRDHALRAGVAPFLGMPVSDRDPGARGPSAQIDQVNPQRRAVDGLSLESGANDKMRQSGFTTVHVIPEQGIFRGATAIALLLDEDPNRIVLRPEAFQSVVLEWGRNGREGYPNSMMGAIAVIRQTMHDARFYQEGKDRFGTAWWSMTEFNPAMEALGRPSRGDQEVWIEPGSLLMVDRLAKVAGEFDLKFVTLASGQEWRRPDLIRERGLNLIVPVDFPEAPDFKERADWEAVSMEQLRSWDWAPENPAVVFKESGPIALTTHGLGDRGSFRKQLRKAIERGLSEGDALAALTTVPAEWLGISKETGTIEKGKLANFTVTKDGGYFDEKAKVKEVWVRGRRFDLSKEEKKKEAEKKDKEEKDKEEKDDKKQAPQPRVAKAPSEYRGPLSSPKALIIRGATLWTSDEAGNIERGDLFVRDGKIERITPADAIEPGEVFDGEEFTVIEASGLHVSPGLIDAHSHAMIMGGVNESTLPSTAMVRVADVINSETQNIYRQLAGGLTIANLLHGSANPIGGQNAVIKLKNGAEPDDLFMEDAPSGIKFALGENVKQSNWGDDANDRFPQTRMGVQTFFNNRFTAALQYQKEIARWKERGFESPPIDLELEALSEILKGDRLIHCHSYRQDEILMLLRLMESFDVRIGTLQHVLEGYKVADEIAAHGAGASSFSDWWAYKFEVYDAIPYSGSLMHERGVLVSFNSDDADLARRMNLEAAKAVKYGGTPEEEALKFVTLNPAIQLGIDHRVGSLKRGKDADFVIWSGPPLATSSVCLETWIEGEKYFDRFDDVSRTRRLKVEWDALIGKIGKGSKGEDGEKDPKAVDKFFETALEFQHENESLHCED